MSEYQFDAGLASKADEAANRLTEGGAYIGRFKKAWAVEAQSGTEGIELGFDSPSGNTTVTLYTRRSDGTAVFGANFVNAMMYLFGLKSLKSVPCKVERYDEDAKARVEVDGEGYPDLCERNIGIVLQKELYTKQGGGQGERLALIGVFQPETRLMVSELVDRKTKPEKLDRLLKGLKVKDTRKAQAAEPSQPSMGGVGEGDY